jgi:hypothetical protein
MERNRTNIAKTIVKKELNGRSLYSYFLHGEQEMLLLPTPTSPYCVMLY